MQMKAAAATGGLQVIPSGARAPGQAAPSVSFLAILQAGGSLPAPAQGSLPKVFPAAVNDDGGAQARKPGEGPVRPQAGPFEAIAQDGEAPRQSEEETASVLVSGAAVADSLPQDSLSAEANAVVPPVFVDDSGEAAAAPSAPATEKAVSALPSAAGSAATAVRPARPSVPAFAAAEASPATPAAGALPGPGGVPAAPASTAGPGVPHAPSAQTVEAGDPDPALRAVPVPAPNPEAVSFRAAEPRVAEAATTHSAPHAAAPARQVAEGVLKASASPGGRFTFVLSPADLGRVEITLTRGDGHHAASVVVDRPEALEAIRAEARTLERLLAESGMDVRSGSVSFALREDRLADGGGAGERQAASRRGPAALSPAALQAAAAPTALGEGRGINLNIKV